MPYIEWSDNYATGIDTVDKDHKNLFLIVNVLHDSVVSGSPRPRLVSLLAALVEYCKKHFRTEELIMRQAEYQGLADHMMMHRDLTRKVDNLLRKFEEDEESVKIEDVLEFMRSWLTNHVLESDMEYVPVVKQAGISDSDTEPANIEFGGFVDNG